MTGSGDLSGSDDCDKNIPIPTAPPPPPDMSDRGASRPKRRLSPILVDPLSPEQEELKENVLKRQKNRESLISSLNTDVSDPGGKLGPTMECYYRVPVVDPVYRNTLNVKQGEFQPFTVASLDQKTMPALQELIAYEQGRRDQHRKAVFLQEQEMQSRLKTLPGGDVELDLETDDYNGSIESEDEEDGSQDPRDENYSFLVEEARKFDAHIMALLEKANRSETLTASEKADLSKVLLIPNDENDSFLVEEARKFDAHIMALLKKVNRSETLTASEKADLGKVLPDPHDENDSSLVEEERKRDAHILALLEKVNRDETLTASEKAELDKVLLDLEAVPALTVDFLDIGQGDSTLFVCDDGTTMMIDIGSVNSGAGNAAVGASLDFLAKTLQTQMIKRGLSKPCIDRFYITHCDQDHYNLLPALYVAVKKRTCKLLEIKQFFVTEDPAKYNEDKTVFKGQSKTAEILKAAKEAGCLVKYEHNYAGDAKAEPVNESHTVSVRTLCANSVQTHNHRKTSDGTESNRNMSSIVVLIEIAPTDTGGVARKILMMGDAESVVENKLLDLHPDVIEKATILHVGHHGSKNSAQKPFIEKVDPQVAQYSADMKFQHPYEENVNRFLNNPGLRINEPLENDPSHPYSVEDTQYKGSGQKIKTTTAGLITNITKIEDHPEALEESKKQLKKLQEKLDLRQKLTAEEKKEKPELSKLILRMESTNKEKKVFPKKSTGEQWRFVFNGMDGAYYRLTDKRDEDFEQLS